MAIAETEARERLAARAAKHLVLNFTPLDPELVEGLPVFVRGEGCWVWDADGRKYFDGLSSLFTMTLGYGYGAEYGAAIAERLTELPFWRCWYASHPAAIELAEQLAAISPPGLDRAYFVQSGSEANEAALKMVRQYHAARGEPRRYKVLTRKIAYHGMTQATLALTAIPDMRAPFEPLPAGARHLAATNSYRHPAGESEELLTAQLLAEAEEAIQEETPELVAAIVLEPLQTSGGCFVPPAGYFAGMRELCDRHGILLVADEVVTAFGRLGEWFGSTVYGIEPDLLTFAKAATAGHAPLGGMLVSDRVFEALVERDATFLHGSTFSGHPVSMAAGLKTLEILPRDGVMENVRAREGELAAALAGLKRHPIVGDVRGAGFLWAIELVRDQETKEGFSGAEARGILHEFLSARTLERGLIVRDDDRGDPVITLAPPLIADESELEWMVDALDTVLGEASAQVRG